MEAALIGLDWGTTSFRGYRVAADGTVLERREAPGEERLAGYVGAEALRHPGRPASTPAAAGFIHRSTSSRRSAPSAGAAFRRG